MGTMEGMELLGCCSCNMAMWFANSWSVSKSGWMMLQLTTTFLECRHPGRVGCFPGTCSNPVSHEISYRREGDICHHVTISTGLSLLTHMVIPLCESRRLACHGPWPSITSLPPKIFPNHLGLPYTRRQAQDHVVNRAFPMSPLVALHPLLGGKARARLSSSWEQRGSLVCNIPVCCLKIGILNRSMQGSQACVKQPPPTRLHCPRTALHPRPEVPWPCPPLHPGPETPLPC